MVNALSKLTAAFLAIVLVYLYPMLQSAERQEYIQHLKVYNELVQFTDGLRNKGYITPTMYEEFAKIIEGTGMMYDIEFEHRHKKYHPEYDDPANANTFKQDFTVIYDSFYTNDLLTILYPISNGLPVVETSKRKYKLEIGDFISITLVKKTRTPYHIISEWIYGTGTQDRGGTISYGGMVLNEDY